MGRGVVGKLQGNAAKSPTHARRHPENIHSFNSNQTPGFIRGGAHSFSSMHVPYMPVLAAFISRLELIPYLSTNIQIYAIMHDCVGGAWGSTNPAGARPSAPRPSRDTITFLHQSAVTCFKRQPRGTWNSKIKDNCHICLIGHEQKRELSSSWCDNMGHNYLRKAVQHPLYEESWQYTAPSNRSKAMPPTIQQAKGQCVAVTAAHDGICLSWSRIGRFPNSVIWSQQMYAVS